jgi:hypothetical protein
MLQGAANVPGVDTVVTGIIASLLGAITGFAASFGMFRSRLTAVEKDIAHLKDDFAKEVSRIREDNTREWQRMREDFARLCDGDSRYWEQAARRQSTQIELLASIARRVGAQNRITDLGTYVDAEGDSPKKD